MSSAVYQQSQSRRGRGIDSVDSNTPQQAGQPVSVLSKPIKRESKITLGGGVYVLVTLFLAIGAINSQNNLLFWLFGVSIATMVVSGVFSGNVLMQVRLQAQGVPDSVAGEAVRLHYTLVNQSRFFPLFAAMISEVHDEHSPSGRFESAAVIHLGPRQRSRVTGVYFGSSRGRYQMRHVRLSTRFPFGLIQKSLIFECPRSMMILPYQLAIKPELVRIIHGQGEEVHRRTDASGVSSEYWGLREYTPGDPKRAIAWKQSARLQRLVVIEHAQPIASKLWVWITRDETDPIMTERAIALGASIVFHSSKRGVPVGLWAPSMGVHLSPGLGKAHTMRCLRALGMINLHDEQYADHSPRAANADDVLVVQAQKKRVTTSGRVRMLNLDEPSAWLLNPDGLPENLGGAR